MTTFHELLTALYEIQGNSDPNDSPASMKERLNRIREIADDIMERTGFQPG